MPTVGEFYQFTGTGILTDVTNLPVKGSACVRAAGAGARGNGLAVNTTAGGEVDEIAHEGATELDEEFGTVRRGDVEVVADDSTAIAIGDNISAGVGAGLFRVAVASDIIVGKAKSATPGTGAGETFILDFYGPGGRAA